MALLEGRIGLPHASSSNRSECQRLLHIAKQLAFWFLGAGWSGVELKSKVTMKLEKRKKQNGYLGNI